MIPGIMAAIKRSPTEIFMISPNRTRTILGGIICPNVPDAATVPVVRHLL